jgi:hypothetical protein
MKRTQLVAALAAAAVLSAVAHSAQATPVTFPLVNVSGSNQSRIAIAATAALSGVPLISAPQFAPGGLNGNGSESSLFNQTATNTPSNMETNLGLYSIGFPGGGKAQATNATGLFGNNLAIAPGVGGVTGTAPADYGVIFTSPQSVVIPPIDVSGLNIPGVTTLNLGTLTGINLNVAIRDFSVDLNSVIIPMAGGGGYPSFFDSTKVNLAISGTADMSLTATLKQDNFTNFLATGVALTALQQGLAGQGINITSTANILGLSYQVGFGFTSPLPLTNAANDDASQGKVEHVGSNLRLTLPVKFDIQPTTLPGALSGLITANFAMSGQLVGQTPFRVVPEPSSVLLAGSGLACAGFFGIRRKLRGRADK